MCEKLSYWKRTVLCKAGLDIHITFFLNIYIKCILAYLGRKDFAQEARFVLFKSLLLEIKT